MNFAIYFIKARSSLILSCSSGPFLLYYATYWRERRELWREKIGEIGQSSITGE